MTQADKAARFLQLHKAGLPLLMPNAWDEGSARILASLGFEALATTSGGYAATLGRLDGSITRAEALAHSSTMSAATELPVSADLENCFADDPAGAAATIELALGTGLAGGSIEDYSGDSKAPIYEIGLAAARVAAAAEAAHNGPVHFVLTARAENYLHGNTDIDDTVARLQAYRDAGADVVFAPGMIDIEEVRRTVAEVGLPVSYLLRPKGPTVSELAEAGVSRISVGGAFALVAYGAMAEAATQLRDTGTYDPVLAIAGSKLARAAFPPRKL